MAAFAPFDKATYDLLEKEFIPLAAGGWIWEVGVRNGVVTAEGKLLHEASVHTGFAYPNDLREGLAKFKKLPEAERKPAPGKRLQLKNTYFAAPPDRGVVLREAIRPLYRASAGELKATEWEPGADYLWLTQAESQAMIPSSLKEGARHPLPESVWRRIVGRQFYHHASTGKIILAPPARTAAPPFTLTVEEASSGRFRLRLEGRVPAQAHCGRDDQFHEERAADLDFQMLGYLEYDARKKSWTRFDVVALAAAAKTDPDKKCKCDGHRSLQLGPPFDGRTQLIAATFELSPMNKPADRTPPALRYPSEEGYFGSRP